MSEWDVPGERSPSTSSEASGEVSLVGYAEGDEEVTRFVETPRPDPPWIVQVTPLDRRLMSTERLLGELQRGEQIRSETLVWREGMLNWRAVAQTDLSSSIHSLERLRAYRQQPSALRLPNMSVGTAALLVSILLALYVLWVGSIFDVTTSGVPVRSAVNAGVGR